MNSTLHPPATCPPPYLQLQHRQYCAVHALNNLFCNEEPRLCSGTRRYEGDADRLFSAEHLDAIAERLQLEHQPYALFNPHRTLWLGNYDLDVLTKCVVLLGAWASASDTAATRVKAS